MLHPVPQRPGPHLFCGPTAICAVTGLDQVDVLAATHRYMQRPYDRPVVGMTVCELVGTMAFLGWRCEKYTINGVAPTLLRLMIESKRINDPVIIELTGHYCAVDWSDYVCNHTDGKLVPIPLAPNLRCRVKSIIEVKKL